MRLEAPVPPSVLEAIRAPFEATPTQTLDAPVLQPLGLLLDLAGETLRERLFVIQSLDGGPEACLRTDFTIPALRAHIASGRPAGRYFYAGHAFRRAPPGSDRAEEFPQIGIEAFEPVEPAKADAEIAGLAWSASAAGGRDDLTLMMGDVGLFAAFVEALDLAAPLASRLTRAFSTPRQLWAELQTALAQADIDPPRSGARLAGLLAGLPESESLAVLEEIWSVAGIEPVGGRSAAEIVHRLAERARLAQSPRLTVAQADMIRRFLGVSGEPEAALEAVAALAPAPSQTLEQARQAWSRRVSDMAAAGVPPGRVRFSAAFGRAFGYYDGMVFEVRSAGLGEAQPVAAGGRYDSLPGKLGARLQTGAVGCMVRPGRAWAQARP